MASTVTLQRTNNYASAFVRFAPLNLLTLDPAGLSGDWVRQFFLSPPFAWRWNRDKVTFSTTQGTADYPQTVASFGWIEKAVIFFPENGNESHELEVENNLAVETNPNQPTKISAQVDDDSGNITFRLVPTPDQTYNVEVIFQKSAPTFANITDTWAPVPDYFSYIYTQGYLAKTYEYINDPRFVSAMQLFTQQLVAANNGLSDAQKNIFLTDRMDTQRQSQNVQQGRG